MGKMLITSSILGCLGPIMSTVGSLGQKLFRPVRLPQEKYDLHAFYNKTAANMHSDHLLTHKLFTEWKSLHGYFPEDYSSYEMILSKMAFRRLDESRHQLFRELKNNFCLEGFNTEAHQDNDGLVRLVLAAGFYPEVAIGTGKRNQLKLRKLSSASAMPSSVNYILGSGTISASLAARGLCRDPYKLAFRAINPRFFIYEELLDVGQKLVSKTTAVDPLVFILLAERLNYKYYLTRNGSVVPHLVVDDWVRYRSTSEQDLKLLIELRMHWNEFLQFVICKKLIKMPFTTLEQQAINTFKEAIAIFASSMNVNRKLIYESVAECDQNGKPFATSSEAGGQFDDGGIALETRQ